VNENLSKIVDPAVVIERLRRAVENLEAAATYIEDEGGDRTPPQTDLVRAEAADDLRELHDVVSRRLDAAIARLRTAVGDERDA
jgi:hypothetical protein